MSFSSFAVLQSIKRNIHKTMVGRIAEIIKAGRHLQVFAIVQVNNGKISRNTAVVPAGFFGVGHIFFVQHQFPEFFGNTE